MSQGGGQAGESGRGGGWTGSVVAPPSGICAETGTRGPADWGPGSVEAGRRVGRGCWCSPKLGLREGLPIFVSLAAFS